MEQLKNMKENLVSIIQAQMGNLQATDTKELGEAIDMVKDLSEAIYYCSIVKAMEEKEEENKYMSKTQMNYPMYYNGGNRNYDGMDGRMWYNGGNYNYANNSGGNNARGGGSRGYSDGWVMAPFDVRDYREGKSYNSRRNYMESKELHHDKAKQMQELDRYAQELTDDILEMIHGATPEEKINLSQKITELANKIK